MDNRFGARIAALAAEPLLHFALLAALIFVLQAAAGANTDEAALAVPQDEIERFVASRTEGGAPNASEIARFTEAWIDEEVLFREGLALNLHRGDPVVRARVVEKMRQLLAADADARTPTTAELESFRDAHRERYMLPARYNTEVITPPPADDRASIPPETVLLALRNGADAREIGWPLQHWTGLSAATARARWGEAFAARLVQSADDRSWQFVTAAQGPLLFRVTAHERAALPAVAEIEARLLRDWQRSREAQAVRTQLATLRRDYAISAAAP